MNLSRRWIHLLRALVVILCAACLSYSAIPTQRLTPQDLEYLGAFRMPHGAQGSTSFAGGGYVATFNPAGDPPGGADGYPGSFYIAGHPYQEMVAEVSIPVPKISASKNFNELNTAQLITPFQDHTEGLRARQDMTCIPSGGVNLGGLAVLGSKLYWTVYWWYNAGDQDTYNHGRSNLLSNNALGAAGMWGLGNYHGALTGGPMTVIPEEFANTHLGGRQLGSFLNFGTPPRRSGAGPGLLAYGAPDDDPPGRASLGVIPLLYYPFSPETTYPESDGKSHPYPGYTTCDIWGGVSWIQSGNKHALIFLGRKGSEPVCYGLPGEWSATSPPNCPDQVCHGAKGWHCDPYIPQMLFYDPSDLLQVVRKEKKPWEIVPYQVVDLNSFIWPNCEGKFGGAAYDEKNGLLYAVQLGAYSTDKDTYYPVVHVWKVSGTGVVSSGNSSMNVPWTMGPARCPLDGGGDADNDVQPPAKPGNLRIK